VPTNVAEAKSDVEFEPQQIGKGLIAVGVVIIVIGVLVIVWGKAGLFRLPGDFTFSGRNWRVYIPLASCILLSLLLTLVLWLINYFRR